MKTVRHSFGGAACAGACLLLFAGGAGTGQEDPAESPRDAIRAGRFVPLERIVAWVEDRYHGRLLEVELEMADGNHGDRPTYEVEWLTPQSNVLEFEFDAESGKLLEVEGRGLDEARRQ